MVNPYTVGALAGLLAGEKHSNLSTAEMKILAKKAKEMGDLVAAETGESFSEEWPKQETPPAPAPDTGAAAG